MNISALDFRSNCKKFLSPCPLLNFVSSVFCLFWLAKTNSLLQTNEVVRFIFGHIWFSKSVSFNLKETFIQIAISLAYWDSFILLLIMLGTSWIILLKRSCEIMELKDFRILINVNIRRWTAPVSFNVSSLYKSFYILIRLSSYFNTPSQTLIISKEVERTLFLLEHFSS